MTERILLLNGPNLNLLGSREPARYGHQTLPEVERAVVSLGGELGVTVVCFQSNTEGDLVDRIQEAAREGVAGAVVNGGGYSHTSVALRDALVGTQLPFVEVHITNVYARERFRRRSLLADVAVGTIAGLGTEGYLLALRGLIIALGAGVGRASG